MEVLDKPKQTGYICSMRVISLYLDLMVDFLLVRRLQPWTYNIGKRLVRSPKIYVRDSGITHALLNISRYNDLLGHLVVGGRGEGFAIENISRYCLQISSLFITVDREVSK